MVKIEVDKERCIGCGLCSSLCAQVFVIGKDGKASVKANKDIPCVKEAIESCPVNAISEE